MSGMRRPSPEARRSGGASGGNSKEQNRRPGVTGSREARSRFRNAFKRRQPKARFRVLAKLARMMNVKQEDEAAEEAEAAPPEFCELVCNGLMLDALERCLPHLQRQQSPKKPGPCRLESFVRSLLDPSVEPGAVDLTDPLFEAAHDASWREKLVSTMEEDIGLDWRAANQGAAPRSQPLKWSSPIELPAPRVRASEGPQESLSGAQLLAWHAKDAVEHGTRARDLVRKADCLLRLLRPAGKGKKGNRTEGAEAEAPQEAGVQRASEAEAMPDTVALKALAGRRMARQRKPEAPLSPLPGSPSLPKLPMAPIPMAPKPASLRPGAKLKEMDVGRLRRDFTTSRALPMARQARLRDLPCEEMPALPARLLYEEGRPSQRTPLGPALRLGQLSRDPLAALAAPGLMGPPSGIASTLREVNGGIRLVGSSSASALPALQVRQPRGLAGPAELGGGLLKSSSSQPQLRREGQEQRAATPLRAACSPTKHVLHSASSGGALPDLPLHASDRFPSLAAKVRNLGSGDRIALTAEALSCESVRGAFVEEVDLGGNSKLEEQQLSELISSLCVSGAAASLQKLSLRRCVCAGLGTISNVIQLLSGPEGSPSLRHLDLSGVQIGLKCHMPLSAAIRAHPALTEVRLADAGLGSGVDVKRCVGDLFSSRTVTTMDLSWNCFSADVFQHLGETMVENGVLKNLSLANCSAAVFTSSGGDAAPAVAHFAEAMARDQALERLDLSLNRIDFRGALCLEDAMESNRTLTHLDLSNNPLGTTGMRCVLRMLVREGSGIRQLECEGTGKGYSTPREFPWEPSCPGARYSLDFSRPQDRALLRKIVKLCHRLGAQASNCLLDAAPNPKWRPPEEKDSRGVLEVPSKGAASFTFSLAKALEGKLGSAGEWKGDAEVWLTRQAELLRQPICASKEVLLTAFWRACRDSPELQLPVLDALSKDFLVTYPQFLALCANQEDQMSTIVPHLLPSLSGGSRFRYLALGKPMSLASIINVFACSRALLSFTPENPTGHYRLQLERPCERAVAQQLLLLDAWEVSVDRSLSRPDVSQKGNCSHWRNERHSSQQLPVQPCEWNLPFSGTLELDYSSNRRPGRGARVLSPGALSNVLVALSSGRCGSDGMLACLRQVADQLFLRCMQFREIIGLFKDPKERAQLFTNFCFRLTDIYNWKLIRATFDTPVVYGKLCQSIGPVALFPFMQPEQASFDLDFSYYDHRFAMNVLCMYLAKERRENLRDMSYVRADGTVDKLEQGVPKSWETLSKIPTGGTFKARYVCAPEHRKFDFRKQQLEAFGYWDCGDLLETEVRWWYTMTDVPVDIIHLITFIHNKWDVPSPSKAFKHIVGDKDSCPFSFFEKAFAKRFEMAEPTDTTRRLQDIFRYFDDSGDGKVSIKEWMVLDQIWQEVRLSVQEFSQFLERTFNERVESLWELFDKDKSGDVSKKEWTQAVASLGYFGPANLIYAFLDPTGKGSLGPSSFAQLSGFERSILGVDTRSISRH